LAYHAIYSFKARDCSHLTGDKRTVNYTNTTFPLNIQLILNITMNYPQCVYDRLKMQVFSFKTKLYNLTNQLHVPATEIRRQQADYESIKRKK
jgi:hypothetical protein